MIELLKIEEIRGRWENMSGGGDDTDKSLRAIAEKLNEVIKAINPEEHE